MSIPAPYFAYNLSPPVLTPEKRIGSLFDSVLDNSLVSRFADVSSISNDDKVFITHFTH